MPELPDIEVYLRALEPRIVGRRLEGVRLTSPFLLRTTTPPLAAARAAKVRSLRRLGKRIAIGLDNDIWLVLHLMIAGRLHWRAPGAAPPARRGLAAFDFADGTLILTEASSRKRASLHLVEGEAALAGHHPGGIEVLEADQSAFGAALRARNHSLKRALTDQRVVSGIGNAYSDEILHHACLSPTAMSKSLDDARLGRLYRASRETLEWWIARLQAAAGDQFPEKVTAFRDGMAVHGRYGMACPRCGNAVARVRYAENEMNYCPTCQTDGKLLADGGLAQRLYKDWPRSAEALEDKDSSGR